MNVITKNWILGILALLAIVSIGYFGGMNYWVSKKYTQQNEAYDELNRAYEIAERDATQYRNKYGELRSRNEVLSSSNVRMFQELRSKDTLIKGMQEQLIEMQKYLKAGGSVTGITQTGTIGVKVPTKVDTVNLYPVYRSTFNLDGWAWGKTTATRDTTYLDFKTRSEMYITHGTERKGFLGLGKRVSFVDVVDKNPYNTTRNIRSFAVTKKSFSFDYGLGGTIGYTTMFDGKTGFGATVGATVNISYK